MVLKRHDFVVIGHEMISAVPDVAEFGPCAVRPDSDVLSMKGLCGHEISGRHVGVLSAVAGSPLESQMAE